MAYELAHRPGDDKPYYTMRCVRGRTLSAAVAEYHARRNNGEIGPLDLRKLLDRSQHAWHEYRDANCRILGDECHALMAQERTAELRYIVQILTPEEPPCGLTNTNVRTILRTDGRTANRSPD